MSAQWPLLCWDGIAEHSGYVILWVGVLLLHLVTGLDPHFDQQSTPRLPVTADCVSVWWACSALLLHSGQTVSPRLWEHT